jgi:hypothetical protein
VLLESEDVNRESDWSRRVSGDVLLSSLKERCVFSLPARILHEFIFDLDRRDMHTVVTLKTLLLTPPGRN